MNINKRPWPLATICGPIRERIDTRPDYQRPLVWSRDQKQMLIDTILRGYDVPKLYWRRVGKNPDRYEVVDGQQRLHAVWDFFDGKYPMASDSEPIDGNKIADLRYSALHDELRIQFDTYPLDIIILEDTEEDEAREMFLRLQGGTTLKKSEKRNAMSGNMRNLVKELARHEFFLHCGFANKRFDFDEVVAQAMLLELNQGPCEVGDVELTKAYREYEDFDFDRGQGKKYADKIRRVYDFLLRAFPEKTPELKKSIVLSLYWLVSTLMTTQAIAGYEKSFGGWFIDFETKRAEDEDKQQDERDPDMVAYQRYSIQATNHRESVDYRHQILASVFLLAFPDLPRLDNQREFTEEQRLAIFRKYDGVCQWVDVVDGRQCETKCTWSDWHADHIIPWSKGGPTTVANGQVLCPRHNLSKGNDLPGSDQTPSSVGLPKRIVTRQSSGSKPVPTKVGAKGYDSILEHLRGLGWEPEQTLGDGRNCYRLGSNRNEAGIFYHSAKQRRGNYDFYFFALTCSLFERLRSKSNPYVFLECGTPATLLILPAEELSEFLRGVPTAHGAINWVINALCDGKSWELKLSGKPRIDVTYYLNRYPVPR